MYKIFSKVNSSVVCHLINRLDDITERTDLVEDHQFLQLATLKLDKGKTFRPHRHIWKNTTRPCIIAQESWVVIRGSVECSFYDIDGTFLEKQIIRTGDCSMTFEGGHTYTILEDNTVVYEYKTGPYTGQQNDKVFI
jgi:cupin fold WbuC family metalloprotein